MFDSPLCDRTHHHYPFSIHWSRLEWLNTPLFIVLLLLAFLGLRWLVKQTQWRRWLSKPIANLLLFGFTATLPLIIVALAAKGLVVFLPSDSGVTTDAIVVLGRGDALDEQRINLAAELWQAKRAPMIFASGRDDSYRLIQQLEAKSIPNRVLDGENCSRNTWENAVFTAAILHSQGIRRILLITDKPHMLRSLLVFYANGFTVIPRTSSLSPKFFNFKAKAFLYLQEYPGLINYALRGLFLPQHSLESNTPELVTLLQKAEQYGQQRHL